MQSSSREIRRKISSKKAEIRQIKSSNNERITQLKDKESFLKNKVDFKERMSLVSGGASEEEINRLDDIRKEIEKLKSDKEKRLKTAEAELKKLQDDYRNNFEKYQKADKKALENKIADTRNTIKRNKVAIIVVGVVAGIFLLVFIINATLNAITVASEESKNFFIDIDDQFTFDCNVSIDSKLSNSTHCEDKEVKGVFSNYSSIVFTSTYYYGTHHDDKSVMINGNNFTKAIDGASVPRSTWESSDFDYAALDRGFDSEFTLELFNIKLNRVVASKKIKVHYNFTEADKAAIASNHSGWVEWEKNEAERKAAEEARKQAEKEEADRKAAEEAAKKKAEEEAKKQAEEEEARKKAEEEAAKKEASTIYKWKKLNDDGTCPSNAELCYIVDSSYGYADYGYGTVKGRILNNSGYDASYMQLSMGIYNASGAKVGDCYDNISGIGNGKTWAFEAYCTGWASGGNLGDLDITWW